MPAADPNSSRATSWTTSSHMQAGCCAHRRGVDQAILLLGQRSYALVFDPAWAPRFLESFFKGEHPVSPRTARQGWSSFTSRARVREQLEPVTTCTFQTERRRDDRDLHPDTGAEFAEGLHQTSSRAYADVVRGRGGRFSPSGCSTAPTRSRKRTQLRRIALSGPASSLAMRPLSDDVGRQASPPSYRTPDIASATRTAIASRSAQVATADKRSPASL